LSRSGNERKPQPRSSWLLNKLRGKKRKKTRRRKTAKRRKRTKSIRRAKASTRIRRTRRIRVGSRTQWSLGRLRRQRTNQGTALTTITTKKTRGAKTPLMWKCKKSELPAI
jgi:hypothetical protein